MVVLEPVDIKNVLFFLIVVPVVLGKEVLQFTEACICVSNLTFTEYCGVARSF